MRLINKKEIAFAKDTLAEENLPFPVVLYPSHYGTFFAFKKDDRSKPCFCSCSYEAIENYLKIKSLNPVVSNTDPSRMFVFDSLNFPNSVVKKLMGMKLADNPIDSLSFEDKLCHECNHAIPSYRFCHEMYGGAFKQNFGWYINKQAYEWGIQHITDDFIPDLCPEELRLMLSDKKISDAKQKRNDFLSRDEILAASEFSKIIQKHHRKIWNIIENEVRRKFGYKNIGEQWTSETILYYIIKKLFPEHEVLRHYRPDFLNGLELDVFIKELNVGIEYQGIQHYKPIKHWGGSDGLARLKHRDKKKKVFCRQNNVSLIYFEYNEGLSDSLVMSRLRGVINKNC
jgi:hypothetical protein